MDFLLSPKLPAVLLLIRVLKLRHDSQSRCSRLHRGESGKHGIETVESLNGALFIDAENGGMGGREQIETDDIGDFRFEIWIVGSHEVTTPMGLQPVAPPDASDAHVPEAEFASQTTAAPVSAPIIGAAQSPLDHFGFQSGRIGSGLTPAMLGDKTAQACLAEPSGPTLHIRSAALQRPGDRAHTLPGRTPQR